MSTVEKPNFDSFLCDTWWYGLTHRFDEKFKDLAKLRAKQGFTTIQMVVGVPPEVGPINPNASSKVGPAWNLKGEFNKEYLDYARQKVEYLNSLGLSVIVYGAWGQQIEWLGEKRMKDWWQGIIRTLDNLDVMYCLTGESDIWIGEEKKLLPEKTTGELNTVSLLPFLHPKLIYFGKRLINLISEPLNENKKEERRKKWSNVLSLVSSLTDKPIFIHVLPGGTSREMVNNPSLLDAITVQTGHNINTRRLLWKLPFDIIKENPDSRFINLEPWYEGITGRFGVEDQLYAYWASMMGGAHSFCYGAQGIWNAGDGKFLAHWGKQTMKQAMELKTPYFLGKSHKLFVDSGFASYRTVEVEEKNGELVKISRFDDKGNFVSYIPEVNIVCNFPEGNIFLPLSGEFSKSQPRKGQAVIFSE